MQYLLNYPRDIGPVCSPVKAVTNPFELVTKCARKDLSFTPAQPAILTHITAYSVKPFNSWTGSKAGQSWISSSYESQSRQTRTFTSILSTQLFGLNYMASDSVALSSAFLVSLSVFILLFSYLVRFVCLFSWCKPTLGISFYRETYSSFDWPCSEIGIHTPCKKSTIRAVWYNYWSTNYKSLGKLLCVSERANTETFPWTIHSYPRIRSIECNLTDPSRSMSMNFVPPSFMHCLGSVINVPYANRSKMLHHNHKDKQFMHENIWKQQEQNIE